MRAGVIRFLKDNEPAGPRVAREASKRLHNFWAMAQDEAANNSIEMAAKNHFGRVAFEKSNVLKSAIGDAALCSRDRRRGLVRANHFACLPYNLGGEHSNVAHAASNIEDAHARAQSRFEKQLAREGRNEHRLV